MADLKTTEVISIWNELDSLDQTALQARIDRDNKAKGVVKYFVTNAISGHTEDNIPIRYVDFDRNLKTQEDQFFLEQGEYDLWKRMVRGTVLANHRSTVYPSFNSNTVYAVMLDLQNKVELLSIDENSDLEDLLQKKNHHVPQNDEERGIVEAYIRSQTGDGASYSEANFRQITGSYTNEEGKIIRASIDLLVIPKIQAVGCARDADEYADFKGYFPLDHSVKQEQVSLLNDFLAAYHPGGSYGGCVVKQGEFKLQIRPDMIPGMNADLTAALALVSEKKSLPSDASEKLTAAYKLVSSFSPGEVEKIQSALEDYKSEVEGYEPPDPNDMGGGVLLPLVVALATATVVAHFGIKALEGLGTWIKVNTKGFLPSFGTNLTQEVINKAQKREVNPYIVGENQHYIKELIALLEPPEEGIKNRSSIQRGRPGVGKTETIRYLAYLSATGQLEQLQGFEFWHLHSDKLSGEGALSGGAKKVEWLVKEVAAAKAKGKTLVVFIDEIHRIVDVDKHSTSDISDVAERLKEHVFAGELIIVGGTTIDEYGKYIGGIPGDPKYTGNPAFAERFRVLDLREASGTQLKTILEARVGSIARASRVTFMNPSGGTGIVDLLMEWSALVEPERAEPRRSIDLVTEFVDSQRAQNNPINLPDLQPGQKVTVPKKPAATAPTRPPKQNLDIAVTKFMDFLEGKLDALARTKLGSTDGKTAIPMADGETREAWLKRALGEVHKRGAMHQQMRRLGVAGLSDMLSSPPAGGSRGGGGGGGGRTAAASSTPPPAPRSTGLTPSPRTGGGGSGPSAMHVEFPISGSTALAPVEVAEPLIHEQHAANNNLFYDAEPVRNNIVAANDGLYEPANNNEHYRDVGEAPRGRPENGQPQRVAPTTPHTNFFGELKAESIGGAATMGLLEGGWMGVEHFTGYHPSHAVRMAVDMPTLYAGTKLIARGATLGAFAEGFLPGMATMMPGMIVGWSGGSSLSNIAGEQLGVDALKSEGWGNRLISAVSGGAGGAVSHKVITQGFTHWGKQAFIGKLGPLGGALMAYPLVGEGMDYLADQAGVNRDYTGRTTIQVTTSGALGYLAHAGIQAAISGAAGTTAATATAATATTATAVATTTAAATTATGATVAAGGTVAGGTAATAGGVAAGISGAAIAAGAAVVTAAAVTGFAVYKNATTTDEELGQERLQDNAWGRFLNGDDFCDGIGDALLGAD